MRHLTISLLTLACLISATTSGAASDDKGKRTPESPKAKTETREDVFKRGMPYFIGDVTITPPNKVDFSIYPNPSVPSKRGGIVRIEFITESNGLRSTRSSFQPGAIPLGSEPVTRSITDDDFSTPREGQKIVLSIVIFDGDGDLLRAMERGQDRLSSNEVDITSKLK